MNKKLLIALVAIVVIAIIGSGVAFYLWNKPHRNVKDADAIKTTAIELYNSFAKDSTTAKSKYTNNIVEVTGTVNQVSKNQQNQTVVLLNTNIQNASVNCTMEGNADAVKP